MTASPGSSEQRSADWFVGCSRVLVTGGLGIGLVVSCLALIWASRNAGSFGTLARGTYAALMGALLLAVLLGALALWKRARAGGIPIRLGVYVFVAGSAVYLGFFQPFRTLFLLVFWGIAAGIFAGLVLAGPRAERVLPAGLLRGLDRILLLVSVLVLTLELGLRLLAALQPSPFLVRMNDPQALMESYRLPPGELHYGFRGNSRGYNDREPPSSREGKLAVTIGDSFSAGIVPHFFHYSSVCERELADTEVYNVGISSCGPVEYLRMLEQDVVQYEPDLVVISLFVGNDIGDARRYVADYRLLRSWFDRENVMIHVLSERVGAWLRERKRSGKARPVSVQGQGQEHAGEETSDPEHLATLFPWLTDPELEQPTFSSEAYLEIELGRALMICREGKLGSYPGLYAVLRELRKRAAPAPLAVMLIPDVFQIEDPLWRQVSAAASRSGPLDRDQPQRVVSEWLEREGIPCLDLLPILREVLPLPDGKRHLYALRDTHLNARGNQVAGRALADFLRPQLR